MPLTECINEIDKKEQIKAGLTLTICIIQLVWLTIGFQIYLFIYLFIYINIRIKSIKHSDLYNSLYTNNYTNGIQWTDIYANLRQPK